MKIPTFLKTKIVDENGYFTPQAHQMFDVLFQQMQRSLSDSGFEIPGLNTSDINYVANNDTANSKPNGTVWYDSQTNEFKGKSSDVVKVFTLT